MANIHHGAPAKNSTAMKTMVSATVVPRSGCSMIRPAISPKTGSTGISSALGEPRVDRRAASTCAIHSSSASLAISLGWNWKPPNRIQLRAPLTSAPMPGISTATSRASETITAMRRQRPHQPHRQEWAAQKKISPTAA